MNEMRGVRRRLLFCYISQPILRGVIVGTRLFVIMNYYDIRES